MNTLALHLLARFATDGIEKRPTADQIAIYEALAETLPTKEEKLSAARVAFAIKEASKLQLDFLTKLQTH